MRKCAFYGCENLAVDDNNDPPMCQQHDDEFSSYVDNEDPKGMLSFWVRMNGGAQRLAGKMMGDEDA